MFKFKQTSNLMSPSLKRIESDLKQVPKKAYDYFVKQTPVLSGNARSKTKLVNDEIRAEYQYAKVLDKGYSKKAPKGMTKPTFEYVRQLIKGIIRR